MQINFCKNLGYQIQRISAKIFLMLNFNTFAPPKTGLISKKEIIFYPMAR
jgi:hypothetical protein